VSLKCVKCGLVFTGPGIFSCPQCGGSSFTVVFTQQARKTINFDLSRCARCENHIPVTESVRCASCGKGCCDQCIDTTYRICHVCKTEVTSDS
jgi:hypothetical protein